MADATDLLLLQQKLRQCSTMLQLGHSIVNQSTRIAKYQVAVLWVSNDSVSGSIQAVSGLPKPSDGTPFTRWAEKLCKKLHSSDTPQTIQIKNEDLSYDEQIKWQEFFPGEVLWVPLLFQNKKVGGLLLGRNRVWKTEELSLLNYWSGAVAHAISGLQHSSHKKRQKFFQFIKNKRYIWGLLVLVVLVCFIPVPLSVNARAEVVPKDPIIVRSPIDGIIGEVNVEPNQGVLSGDLVLSFDDRNLQAQNDVSEQELAIAVAEFQSSNQASVTDRSVAAQLPMLQAIIDQREVQLRYTQSLLERSSIYADMDGIVIIPKVNELEGKPVQIGEKLFTVASAGNVELEFWLAVGDSIPLFFNSDMDLFLNVDPLESHAASLRYINFQAEVSPDGILGYRGRAEFSKKEELRIGGRGTVKIYGEKVTLFYFLFRRPLSILRQWVGI